jgi:hypothetical protein
MQRQKKKNNNILLLVIHTENKPNANYTSRCGGKYVKNAIKIVNIIIILYIQQMHTLYYVQHYIGHSLSTIHPGRTKGIRMIQGGSNMTGTNCDLFTHK